MLFRKKKALFLSFSDKNKAFFCFYFFEKSIRKERNLKILCIFFRRQSFPCDDLDGSILFFRYRQNANGAAERCIDEQPLHMLFRRIRSVAQTGIDGKLQHIISVLHQPFSEGGCRAPLFLGAHGQIKKYHQSHMSTHTNAHLSRSGGA